MTRSAVLAIILTIWVAIACCVAATRVPWSNEAWGAIPAVNLAEHGSMGTSVLAYQGTWLQGLNQHTYWMMPLHILVQAGWYKLAGFGVLRQRLISVFFGVVALVAWFYIVLRLTNSPIAATLCVMITGFEHNFLITAGNGRMDMMAAALGGAGIAVWINTYERAPKLATLASHALVAAAILTHPCGVIFAVVLLFVSLQMQHWRLAANTIALIPIPYIAAVALWGLYIAQAPSDFASQFFGNASGFAGEYLHRDRFNGLTAPWRAVYDEIHLRYFIPFGFPSLRTPTGFLNATWLTICCATVAVAIGNRSLRRTSAIRVLAGSLAIVFFIMTFFEGLKFPHYLVHSLPFVGSVTAVVITELWMRRSILRILSLAALFILITPQTAEVLRECRRNPYRTAFLPPANLLRKNMGPADHVIAPAELGYVLGFTDALSDDVRLGYYTGLRPRYFVTSAWYNRWFERSQLREPLVAAHIRQMLRDYHQIFTNDDYSVYERISP